MNFDNDFQQTHEPRGCIFVIITILARCAGFITSIEVKHVSIGYVVFVLTTGSSPSFTLVYRFHSLSQDGFYQNVEWIRILLLHSHDEIWCLGILLISTGLLYFIKTFKYKRISVDEKKDETTIAGNSSTSTETSTTEIDET
ncbi:hypothetical protein I4U23_029604 [Adineta vaga]|nr:hypothetical protein I4U23_029604 [Adineta vaga]